MVYSKMYRIFKEGGQPPKEIPLEKYFKQKIIKYLKTVKGCVYWSATQGNFSTSGIPDICCIYKGRFYGFEIKRPWVGKVSKLQEETIKKINEAGAYAGVVSFLFEVKEILGA